MRSIEVKNTSTYAVNTDTTKGSFSQKHCLDNGYRCLP